MIMQVEPAFPTLYDQWLPLLPFIGVILGGILAVAGTVITTMLTTRSQHKHWQRDELLKYLLVRREELTTLFDDIQSHIDDIQSHIDDIQSNSDAEGYRSIMRRLTPEYTIFKDYLELHPYGQDWNYRFAVHAREVAFWEYRQNNKSVLHKIQKSVSHPKKVTRDEWIRTTMSFLVNEDTGGSIIMPSRFLHLAMFCLSHILSDIDNRINEIVG